MVSGQSIDRRAVMQNLEDAGCTREAIQQFIRLLDEGKPGEQLRLLASERARLLDDVHTCSKRLDCLDYLIYSLRRMYQ